jgi:serine/threonine-protein kinase
MRPLESGQTVSHYRILDRLGTGGMGVVYRAEDLRLGRAVALKFLHEDIATDPDAIERFRREARAASSLNHPHVCTVHDVGEFQGRHFMVMELLEGRSLRDAIAPEGPLPIERVLTIGAQVAEALEAAHARGIVHRDLKPANVFITAQGQAKVVDFGLAKVLPAGETETPARSLTAANLVMGTLPYMAPEQLLGTEVDARTDIHAFGALLYEMATGLRPYRREPLPRLTDEILHEPPKPPGQINPAMGPELEAIILRCLAKRPEDRYPTMTDVLRAIRSLKGGVVEPSGRRGRSAFSPRAIGVVLFLVAIALALLVGSFRSRNRDGSAFDSLAVLPLENLSGDPEQEYFTDGMTEALIADLSRVESLRVISRTSSMRYRESDKSIPEIAKELDVDVVVEGSVLRSGDRVRITAQLIAAAQDRHLWAESYERELGDILALQSEVARSIAAEVRHRLTSTNGDGGTARPIVPEAYEAYLKGRYFWNRRTAEALKTAIRFFETASALDPAYAPAFAGIADCELLLSLYPMAELPPSEAMPRAHQAARRALELDDNLAEAHTSLAYERFWSWDFAASEREFRRAIELNANYAPAHFWYAARLAAEARFEEALAEATTAQKLDPVSPILKAGVSWMHHFAQQFDQEIFWARETLALDPSFLIGRYRLGEGLLHSGNHAESIPEFEKGVELSHGSPDLLALLGHGYAVAGERERAESILARLREASRVRYVPAWDMALVHLALGNVEESFQWLDKAFEERAQGLAHIKVDPHLDPIRSDPRFEALLRRVGLPD